MEQKIKSIISGLAAVAILGGINFVKDQQKKINYLERELSAASNRVAIAKLERDNYRRDLIQHGNPEGWVLNGDSFTGASWYERLNGDGIGGCWTETLEYK